MFFLGQTSATNGAVSNGLDAAKTTTPAGAAEEATASEVFGQSMAWLRENTDLQHWTTFGILVLLGILVGGGLSYILRRRAADLKKRRRDSVMPLILDAVRRPVAIFLFAYFFSAAVDVFKLPSWLWMRVNGTLFPIIYGIAFLSFIFRSVDVGMAVVQKRFGESQATLEQGLMILVGRLIKGIVVLIGVMVILDNLGIKVMALLTGLGFLGAAVALAAQHTLANVFAAVNILMDKMFKLGDRIRFDDYDGFVVQIGLRSIKLRSMTGETLILPNKEVSDRQIRNLTKGSLSLVDVSVGITYDSDRKTVERAMKLLEEIMLAHPRVKECTVRFKALGAYSLDIAAFGWAEYTGAGEYGAILSDIYLAIKERFDAEGIRFAFPTQTLDLPPDFLPKNLLSPQKTT